MKHLKRLLTLLTYIAVIFAVCAAVLDAADRKKKALRPHKNADAGSDDVTYEVSPLHSGFYERYVKRPLDAFCAVMLLGILSPLLAALYALVQNKLGSPAIFTQERPGLNGHIFKLYKFRSMTDAKDENGEPLPDEERLTDFGKKLRASSLDELPELVNIIKGDMSFVGPRPLLTEYLPLYNKRQARRHEVRPGITGLAQVNGRNALSWEERFKLDVSYVDNITFTGDLKIIAKTLSAVINREGIHSDTSVTVEKFTGSETHAQETP